MADPEKRSRDLFGLVALNDFRKQSGFTCTFMIFAALNISMVVIGGQHLNQCPVSHMIPVYLVGKCVILCKKQRQYNVILM